VAASPLPDPVAGGGEAAANDALVRSERERASKRESAREKMTG